MHNVLFDDSASDARAEFNARFRSFLEWNDFRNGSTSERNDQGQTGGLDAFAQFNTPRCEIGYQTLFLGRK
jgi:hypothetical protein